MHIEEFVHVDRIDYKGREYANFYPVRNRAGTGYVVEGRCTDPEQYDGRLVKVCATLIKRYADGQAFHVGFRRERDAYEFSLYLNGTDAGTIR
jgi:hypothetical protein